jgi:O-antigen polymerase
VKVNIKEKIRKFCNIFSWFEYALVALLFFLPFVNYILHTRQLDVALFYPVGLLIVIGRALHGKTHMQLNGLGGALLLFFLYLTIRGMVKDPGVLLTERYTSIALILLIFFAFREYKHLYLRMALIIAGLLQNMLAFLQFFGFAYNSDPLFRVGASFGNPGVYAGYLVPLIPISLLILWRVHKVLQYKRLPALNVCRWICICFLLSSLILLPVTGSRAAWLAAITGSVCIFLFYRKPKFIYLKRKSLVISIGLFVLFLAGWVLYQYKPLSVIGRVLVWKVSINMFGANPLFGMGFTGFEANYANYQAKYFAASASVRSMEAALADNTYTAFNELLEMAVEEGIAGLLLFTIPLIIFLRRRGRNPNLAVAKASVLCILIFGCTGYPFHIHSVLVNVTFVLALIPVRAAKANPLFNISMLSRKLTAPFLLIALPLFFYTLWRVPAVQRLQEIARVVNSDDPARSLAALNRLSPTLYRNKDYMICRGIVCYRLGRFSESILVLKQLQRRINSSEVMVMLGNNYKALGKYGEAEDKYRQASLMVPNRFVPKYMLMRLYIEMNRTDEAMSLAADILTMKEKVPSVEVQQIKFATREFYNNPH